MYTRWMRSEIIRIIYNIIRTLRSQQIKLLTGAKYFSAVHNNDMILRRCTRRRVLHVVVVINYYY